MTDLFVHIGLHKTGTTTLQEHVWPRVSEINLLTTRLSPVQAAIWDITRTDPLYFNPEKTRALLGTVLDSARVNLLSNESLSGPPFAGAVEWGLDNRSAVTRNLQAALPNAKVLIVIRRQDELALSMYRQYVKSGGTRSAKRFFGKDAKGPAIFSRDRFHYLPFLRDLQARFPKALTVLVYEQMRENYEEFVKTMNAALGTSWTAPEVTYVNATRLGWSGLLVTRALNHLFRNHLNRGILPGIPLIRNGRLQVTSPVAILHDHWPIPNRGKGPLDRIAQELLDECRAENAIMAEEFALPIQRFGYY